MAISGTTPDPPPTSRAGVSPPDEPAADRAPHLELVAGHDLVVEEHRHLPPCEALDRDLELGRAVGGRGHRVGAGGGVAVRRGEPDDVVLAGEVAGGLSEPQAERLGFGVSVADG